MAAFGVFGLCQIHAFVDYLRSKLNPQQFEVLFRSVISLVGFVLLTVGALLMLTGREGSWPFALDVNEFQTSNKLQKYGSRRITSFSPVSLFHFKPMKSYFFNTDFACQPSVWIQCSKGCLVRAALSLGRIRLGKGPYLTLVLLFSFFVFCW